MSMSVIQGIAIILLHAAEVPAQWQAFLSEFQMEDNSLRSFGHEHFHIFFCSWKKLWLEKRPANAHIHTHRQHVNETNDCVLFGIEIFWSKYFKALISGQYFIALPVLFEYSKNGSFSDFLAFFMAATMLFENLEIKRRLIKIKFKKEQFKMKISAWCSMFDDWIKKDHYLSLILQIAICSFRSDWNDGFQDSNMILCIAVHRNQH